MTAAVAGLDAGRFGWSSLPFEAVYLGVPLTALGYVVGTWAMAVNAYFEPTVRIHGSASTGSSRPGRTGS